MFAAYTVFVAARVNYAVALMLLALTATFVLLAIGLYNGNGNVTTIGGWLAMATGVLCWYASAADAINNAFGRVLLPTRNLKFGTPLEPEYRRPELA